MIAYHVDRENNLQKDQIITLYKNDSDNSFFTNFMFPDGLSYHGLHYTNETLQNIGGNQASFYILEYELELIRRSYFPNLPSRYQSFFAIKTVDEISKWNDIFDTSYVIWKIEFEEANYIIRDSNMLYSALKIENNISTFSAQNSFLFGYNYWKGHITSNPRFEMLIKPPIKIIEKMEQI